jgi:hypothetical protein
MPRVNDFQVLNRILDRTKENVPFKVDKALDPHYQVVTHRVLGVRTTNLDLRGVQVHGDDVVSPGNRQHVGHQFC